MLRLTILLGLGLLLAGLLGRADTGYEPIDTLDARKAAAHPFARFAANALWPTPATIAAKHYTGNVDTEVGELVTVLTRVLRADCLPTESVVKQNVIALTELRNGNDYLLLRYRTAGGIEVQVQDGKGLYLLVTLPEAERAELSDAANFVWRVADRTLKFPQFEGQGPAAPKFIVAPAPGVKSWKAEEAPPYVPRVFVSSIDLGQSRVGAVYYGPTRNAHGVYVPNGWYSGFYWWSDGRRVLFALDKKSEDDYQRDFESEMTNPSPVSPPPGPPGVFRSRAAAGK
jgi:hypothetical protein